MTIISEQISRYFNKAVDFVWSPKKAKLAKNLDTIQAHRRLVSRCNGNPDQVEFKTQVLIHLHKWQTVTENNYKTYLGRVRKDRIIQVGGAAVFMAAALAGFTNLHCYLEFNQPPMVASLTPVINQVASHINGSHWICDVVRNDLNSTVGFVGDVAILTGLAAEFLANRAYKRPNMAINVALSELRPIISSSGSDEQRITALEFIVDGIKRETGIDLGVNNVK